MAGTDALPDMTDSLPTFEESMGEESTGEAGGSGEGGGGTVASTDPGSVPGTMPGDAPSATASGQQGAGTGQGSATPGGVPSGAQQPGGMATPGTRAEGGMTSGPGAGGVLTPAEQVAILDRQLEESTSDFDTMILEEQNRQRTADRERAARAAESQAETTPEPAGGRNPYRDDVPPGAVSGSAGGGVGGSHNTARFEPPEDIPGGNDDDVVARQLREAAMREPDPEVRERLWNEYRKYKGLEIPE